MLVLCVPYDICPNIQLLPDLGMDHGFSEVCSGKGYFGSEFVGLANFKEAFTDANFINAIRNTLLTSVLKISQVLFPRYCLP